jgi:hypothetical protein
MLSAAVQTQANFLFKTVKSNFNGLEKEINSPLVSLMISTFAGGLGRPGEKDCALTHEGFTINPMFRDKSHNSLGNLLLAAVIRDRCFHAPFFRGVNHKTGTTDTLTTWCQVGW